MVKDKMNHGYLKYHDGMEIRKIRKNIKLNFFRKKE
jgi:hypothetical protein